MSASGPPAYAWDWFARQRLLWREARSRLGVPGSPAAARYAGLEERGEVVTLLRADYPRDEVVRRTVDAVVGDVAFLGRTDRRFAELGARTAPRGMRWWWTALTGEELDRPSRRTAGHTAGGTDAGTSGSAHEERAAHQLTLVDLAEVDPEHALDDVAEGYGDRHR